jgi:SMODS and SLOG-associating 2TM effector domain 1/SMODS and SLOG-associating 2TM effector domain 3
LAWRYAVKGKPFTDEISNESLKRMFRQRVKSVIANGGDRIIIQAEQPLITEKMTSLRNADFGVRKAAYITGRTTDQLQWYARKAQLNKSRAELLRVLLLVGESVAIVLTVFKISGAVPIDLSGILAALISSTAAWLGLKQYSQLASAYSVASSELAIQRDVLEEATESSWGQAVADAEEAISREHTMWLASRGERNTA